MEGKSITFHGLDHPKLTWGLPTLTTWASWFPWRGIPSLSSGLWLQYPSRSAIWQWQLKAITINTNIAILSLISNFSLVYILPFFPLLIHGLLWPSHLTDNFKLLQYKLHKFETTSDLLTFSVTCKWTIRMTVNCKGPFCDHECDSL